MHNNVSNTTYTTRSSRHTTLLLTTQLAVIGPRKSGKSRITNELAGRSFVEDHAYDPTGTISPPPFSSSPSSLPPLLLSVDASSRREACVAHV
jgi:hypothetical protein